MSRYIACHDILYLACHRFLLPLTPDARAGARAGARAAGGTRGSMCCPNTLR